MPQRPYYFLHVEDDADYAALLEQKLSSFKIQHEMVLKKTGEEAWAYLMEACEGSTPEKRIPDLIFLDILFPAEDGLATLKRIKAHDQLRNIPVIVVSISKDQNHVVQTYKLGGTFFMSKSSDPTLLKEVLNRLTMLSILKHSD